MDAMRLQILRDHLLDTRDVPLIPGTAKISPQCMLLQGKDAARESINLHAIALDAATEAVKAGLDETPLLRLMHPVVDLPTAIEDALLLLDRLLIRHAVHSPSHVENVPLWFGDGRIEIDGETHYLTATNDQKFLETLISLGGHAQTSHLEDAGITNPSETAKRVMDWNKGRLASFIKLPKGKKNAGYRTSIRDGRKTSQD